MSACLPEVPVFSLMGTVFFFLLICLFLLLEAIVYFSSLLLSLPLFSPLPLCQPGHPFTTVAKSLAHDWIGETAAHFL